MQVIIWTDKDGLHRDSNIELIKSRYDIIDSIIIDDCDIPDKYFRDAWTLKDGKLVIDIKKAKEIKKEKLRVERKPLLEALDVEVIKNIANADKIAEIEAQKQPLRDITSLVDECKTLDQIREVTI